MFGIPLAHVFGIFAFWCVFFLFLVVLAVGRDY